MRDVVAPLYRFFLADAQEASRAGDTERMSECLALALDFAPEGLQERVLLAAAELLPPAGSPHAPSPAATFVVAIAEGELNGLPTRRIAWEPRPMLGGEPTRFAESVESGRPVSRTIIRRTPALLMGALLVVGAAAAGPQWVPDAPLPLLGDPEERAERSLAAQDYHGALRLLAPVGEDAPASTWLLRAAAHEALAQDSLAVAALSEAARRDVDGGEIALLAGDRLIRLGADSSAADAYLFAVTPDRTDDELDRIARVQVRAGFVERASRVRRPPGRDRAVREVTVSPPRR